MSELIARHNLLAAQLGVAEETSFKSLKVARAAVTNLENKMNQATNTTDTNTDPVDGMTDVGATAPEADKGDRQKYNSSGKRGPNQGIGAYAKERIQAGKTNAEIIAEIQSNFPGAKTTPSCIAYYRTALKKGPARPDPAQLRVKAAELVAQAEAAEKAQAEEDAAAAAAPAEPEVATA